jgi:hypothetical protein
VALVETPAAFLAEFGRLATFNGATARVILDSPDAEIMGGRVLSRQYVMTLPAGVFSNFAPGGSVVIEGVTYSVQQVRSIEDGAWWQAELERA